MSARIPRINVPRFTLSHIALNHRNNAAIAVIQYLF